MVCLFLKIFRILVPLNEEYSFDHQLAAETKTSSAIKTDSNTNRKNPPTAIRKTSKKTTAKTAKKRTGTEAGRSTYSKQTYPDQAGEFPLLVFLHNIYFYTAAWPGLSPDPQKIKEHHDQADTDQKQGKGKALVDDPVGAHRLLLKLHEPPHMIPLHRPLFPNRFI